MIYINDTRPLSHKLADLIDETLLDRMERGLRQFSNFTDPCGVMSYQWLWSRWIRNKGEYRKPGDIVVWKFGVYGHIAILLKNDKVFEENVNVPGNDTFTNDTMPGDPNQSSSLETESCWSCQFPSRHS